MIAFGLQLVFAILFWAFCFIDGIAISTFRPGYTKTRFTKWLSNHHETCLWSQLLYTFVISLAGVIRHATHREISTYESSAIMSLVAVSSLSLTVTLVCFFEPTNRGKLFSVAFPTTLVLALAAQIYPIRTAKTENLLNECEVYAARNNLPWRLGAIRSFQRQAVFGLGVVSGSILALLGLWACIWRLRRGLMLVPNRLVSRGFQYSL